MKVMTLNANGLRSAARKGFFEWFAGQDVDVLCLQEVRASADQLPPEADLPGYARRLALAARPGYAGCALYARTVPARVCTELSALDPAHDWSRFDEEGRFLLAEFGDLAVVCLYVPSGSSSWQRQAGKMRHLGPLLEVLAGLARERELVVCGDFNIAHTAQDIKNARGNRKNSGFLPEERAWMDELLDAGFVDLFRRLHPDEERYSWWSNRGRARENNVGWRIDYVLATPGLAARCTEAAILDPFPRFSDHAPVWACFA